MDQAQYTYQLFSHSYLMLNEIVSSKQYSTEGFVAVLLNWVAKTFNSDAFLLSWLDAKGLMRIQELAVINTPALKECKTLVCFDRLREWLDSDDEDPWVYGDTSDMLELQNVHIKSLIVTKVFTREVEDFQGKQLLVVCNRASPAFEGNVYVGYDRLFLRIAQWMLLLYISDLYKLNLERYEDAKRRYEDARIASSLILVGETADKLLDLYNRYCARPPLPFLYDCLDAHIALFNAKQIDEGKLRKVLENCEKHWLAEIQESQSENLDLVRCALARGYFALGIQKNKDWIKGKELLST